MIVDFLCNTEHVVLIDILFSMLCNPCQHEEHSQSKCCLFESDPSVPHNSILIGSQPFPLKSLRPQDFG